MSSFCILHRKGQGTFYAWTIKETLINNSLCKVLRATKPTSTFGVALSLFNSKKHVVSDSNFKKIVFSGKRNGGILAMLGN